MSTTLRTTNVSRETLIEARTIYEAHFDEFEKYIDELMWWNIKVNLVSRNVSRETVREHIVHSLIVIPLGLIESSSEWVDAGTGGGLPGIPLAIVTPDIQWVLNDVISKKIAAVKQIVHKLNLLNAEGEAEDIQQFEFKKGGGIITKHAFSAGGLFGMIRDKPWKKLIMYKGVEESKLEFNELDGSVKGELFEFDFGGSEPFYEGKGVLVIERNDQ
jgi:16S rRNA (guanine527-N7)-methyltransferase